MASKLTVRQFFEKFPSDETCLEHVMSVRYGLRHECRKCHQDATFHRLEGRKAYSCSRCGDHLYPCAGTIFQDSRTSLQLWFYAMYLFVATRHGVSGKELERTLGVTYKTAYRMGQQIRDLMGKANGIQMLQGHVEIDEAYVGGYRPGKRGRGAAGKTIVMGMKERGGNIIAEVIPNTQHQTLRNVVERNVEPGSTVSTDELISYNLLKGAGYTHGAVKHGAKQWAKEVDGVKFSTNSVEGFWRLFKASVRSTHIHVSGKHMERYLGEFTFRSNHRQMENAMLDLLIGVL
jgi:transposase-like protein